MGTRLYVGNLPYDVDEDSIKQFFEGGGGRQVKQVKIVTDRDTGRPRGFAFVEMADDAQAQSAINELNSQSLGGRTIVVNEAREPQRGGGGGGGGAAAAATAAAVVAAATAAVAAARRRWRRRRRWSAAAVVAAATAVVAVATAAAAVARRRRRLLAFRLYALFPNHIPATTAAKPTTFDSTKYAPRRAQCPASISLRHLVLVGRERRVRADEADGHEVRPAGVDAAPAAVHRGEEEADDGAAGDVDEQRGGGKAGADAAGDGGGDAVARQRAERAAERDEERVEHAITLCWLA